MAVQSLYPGTQVTIGPVIEDGFFYDFAPKTPFTVEDLPKIEAKMRELAKADHKIQRTEVSREDAIREILVDGREVQSRDHPGDRRRHCFDLQPGRLEGSVPRAARALDALPQGIQADQRCGSVLARRRAQRDAHAHLRHFVPDQGSARGASEDGGAGAHAGPSQARARDGPLLLRSDLAGLSVFPAQGRDDLKRAGRLYVAASTRATVSPK